MITADIIEDKLLNEKNQKILICTIKEEEKILFDSNKNMEYSSKKYGSQKGEYEMKSIELNDRLKYTNIEYGTTIIEIKEKDNIKNYLELDNTIIKDILNNENENIKNIEKTIYIITNINDELSVSFGTLTGKI